MADDLSLVATDVILYIIMAICCSKRSNGDRSTGALSASRLSSPQDEGCMEEAPPNDIYIEDLSVQSKDGSQILRNVSMRFGPASLNGVLGLSGSGKSTLLAS